MAGDNPIAAAAGEGAKPQDPKAGEGTRPPPFSSNIADNGTTVNASSFGLYSIVTFTLIPAAISTPGTGFRRRRIRYN